MPTLSRSEGKDRVRLSLNEVRRIFEGLFIVKAIGRNIPDAKSEAEDVERLNLLHDLAEFETIGKRICKLYGATHLDAEGYPKETEQRKAATK